jgi:pilus assembly protein Flp/PilA
MRGLSTIFPEQRGATSVEYALILALVFLAMVAGVVSLGTSTKARWTNVAEQVRDA